MQIPKKTVEAWRATAVQWMRPRGHTPDEVQTGRDAWYVAQACGINAEGYARGFKDGHIQTALCSVFPNVQFDQKPTY